MKQLLSTIKRSTSGFSLVEFIVIISIFSVMAGISLFNYSGFNTNVSLNNLAHDIALTIRQAQVYGISATEAGSSLVQIRGVHFTYGNGQYAPTFRIFVDADGNSNSVIFNTPPDVVLDDVSITTNDIISVIEYGSSPSATAVCTNDFVIAFQRPNPDPLIFCGQTPSQFARITVQSGNGQRIQYIEIWPTGQIVVVDQPTASII